MWRQLKKTIAACDDGRARTVHAEIKQRPFDLDLIAGVITGSASPQTSLIQSLREYAATEQVTLDDVVTCTAELNAAHGAVADGADAVLQLLADRTELLRSARAYVAATGDDDCPVCEAPLAKDWGERVEEAMAESEAKLVEHRQALTRLTNAKRSASELVARLRPFDIDVELDGCSAHASAVASAQALPTNSAEWAAHLETTMPTALTTSAAVAEQAEQHANELEDEWAPVAVEVAAWIQAEQAARTKQSRLDVLDAAKLWLKEQGEVLRDRRLEPVASKAREIWAQLRQESGVDLGSITLEGAGTSKLRYVSVQGSVEGEDTGILSVMSQGELHALALALFIPRATVASSPFGFIVLDDPIQAMDPAKIDGFLSVLQELGKTRQVIVFSHDDRLPAAIRRLSVEADLVEVTREPGSRVIAKPAESPAHRYVDDAFALIVDDNVSDVVKAKAAPGLFRFAVESAARQRYFRDSAKDGVSAARAEAVWLEARKTGSRVALAVHGDPARTISGWVHHRQYRQPTIAVCTAGVHNGQILDKASVSDLRKTVDDILDQS